MNLLHGLFSVLFIVEISELEGKHSFFSQALLKGEVVETMSHAKFIAAILAPAKYLNVLEDKLNDANREMLTICTAFILSKTEIITNAHCVDGAPYVFVVAGTKNVSDANLKIIIKVEKENIAYHPYYNHLIIPGAFDIAKITLKMPLEFSDTVGNIELVDKDYKLNDPSEVVTAYGYGVLNNQPSILRRCDANYIFDVKRASTFKISQTLYFTTGEATNDGQIITQGDSGGPVVSKTNGKIVGITIGTNRTANGRGKFLPITLFLDFIHDPKSVKPIPPPLTPNEAKFIADITVPGKFLTVLKNAYADSDRDIQFNAIILSKTEILTCAHSVLGAPYVYVTVDKLSRNATKLKVTEDQIEIHEKYDLSGWTFDIAKITLKEPLNFNDNVESIDLVDKNYEMNDPSEVVTVYGDMILDGTMGTRRYDTKYLNGTKCKPKVGAVFDANHLMCYTLDGSMGTPLTFGGPMISKKKNKLVGMTIIRYPDQPVIFQPIVPLLDWIRKPKARVICNQRR
ncbi:uncharacterized protein LOC129579913 [Sitodiplosis mosellana]|uniref:uncharacterized protein LOC129579913 n=1 Tax=Sitodiplosis mosellana TaxID=263140 RepID=UPI002445067E|nr:uncharacterized protein LOC129579913 [Sitodiplosis mosellana]